MREFSREMDRVDVLDSWINIRGGEGKSLISFGIISGREILVSVSVSTDQGIAVALSARAIINGARAEIGKLNVYGNLLGKEKKKKKKKRGQIYGTERVQLFRLTVPPRRR